MRIAVFGGTFNPPHLGHVGLARAVVDGKLADKVLFVPAYRPPHKPGNPEIEEFSHRTAMLELALRGMNWAEISTLEGERPELPSYTVDTMRRLEAERPGDELLLLIGEDSLAQLHTWREAECLAERWRMLSYPRLNAERASLEGLRAHWPVKTAERLWASRVDLPIFDLSSTRIRELFRDGADVTAMTGAAVAGYMEENSLYQWKKC